MSKYKVEIGGFVNEFINSEVGFEDVFRHISIIVEAETEEYAKKDAEEAFFDIAQDLNGNLCDDCIVASVECRGRCYC